MLIDNPAGNEKAMFGKSTELTWDQLHVRLWVVYRKVVVYVRVSSVLDLFERWEQH